MSARDGQTDGSRVTGSSTLRRRPLGRYRYVRLRWRILFALIDAVGSVLWQILGCVMRRRARTAEKSPVRRILLVQLDHLGDALLTTGMFGPLKRRFPRARIEVLAAPWNRAVFDSASEVDQTLVCKRNRFSPGRSLAWIPATIVWGLRMRRRRFDLVVDVRGEFPHNVLLWLSGAPRRIGWGSGGGGFLLTHQPTFVADRPEIESRQALLECLGVRSDGPLSPVFRPSDSAMETAETAWRALRRFHGQPDNVDPSQTHAPPASIVFHIGAGTPAKRWPVQHWRQLLRRLATEANVLVGLVGTAEDAETARAILGTPGPADAVDWTGRFTLDELAAVLRQADVFVGADSGPAHLASTVSTPVVALFSGTNRVEQWQPRGPVVRTLQHGVPCSPCHRRSCPVPGHPCMAGLDPDAVLDSVLNVLVQPDSRPQLAAAFSGTIEE